MVNIRVSIFLILICLATFNLPRRPLAQDSADRPTTQTATLSTKQERMRRLVRLSTYRHQLNLYAGPFLEMDANRDNILTPEEARLQGQTEAEKRGVSSSGLQSQHLQFISNLDQNEDKQVSLAEIRANATEKADEAVEDYLEQVIYDDNNDGLINGEELRKLAEKKAREKWKEEDINKDGRWTVSEIFGKATIEESAAHFKNEQVREMQIRRWKEQWAELDPDNDGYATLEDRLRLHRQSPPKIASKYERRPNLNPDYTLFRERVRFAETGKRCRALIRKYSK